MAARFIITAVTYILCGMIPPLAAHYLIRVRFIGGVWGGVIVGMVAAFAGGLLDVFLLAALPDLLPIARVVDAGPPLIVSIAVVVVYGFVSRSNESAH
jgi:hypothetical protein